MSQLWEEYTQKKSTEIRNLLVKEYIHLVGKQVTNMSIPYGLEMDDLRQFGIMGLMAAVEKYDPSKGVFEAFAKYKIRGAILDQLRIHRKITRGDSRTIKDKINRIETATRELEQKLQRQPSSKEISEQMNISVEEYYKLLSEIGTSGSISLDELVGAEDNLSLIQVIKNEASINPEEELMRNERLQLLQQSIDELPERLKLILTLYYHREFTFSEIATVIEKTEARVSQLHTETILRLRAKFRFE